MLDLQGTYRYTRISDSQIRLLLLDPEKPGAQNTHELSGVLETFELTVIGEPTVDDAPKYEALSYTWGGVLASNTTPVITIYDAPLLSSERRKKLGTIVITPNLDQALRQFRPEISKVGRYLWIDAICIQQEGEGHGHEKGAQIRRMPDIFSEADTVRIWLGLDEANDSRQCFEFIRSILSLDNFKSMCEETYYAPKWATFSKLMQRAWFQRRWIVQEVAFSSNATVYCGSQSVSWSDFASAVQLFASKKSTLRGMFQKADYAKYDASFLGEIEALAATQLVKTLDLLFRRSNRGIIMTNLLSLETLLTNMTAFDVTRPHDAVYAIMRLSHNATPVSLPIEGAYSRDAHTAREVSNQLPPVLQLTVPSESLSDGTAHWDSRSHERLSPVGLGDPNSSTDAEQATHDDGAPRGRTSKAHKHLSSASISSLHSARGRSPGRTIVAARRKAEGAKSPVPFNVDYDQSIFKLCTDIINFCIMESKSIDIICRPWVPSLPAGELVSSRGDTQFPLHKVDTFTLPSWMCSAENRPHEAQAGPSRLTSQYRKLRRINAESLVGSGLKGSKSYSADGEVPMEPSDYRIEDRILSAKGFELATIDLIHPPAQNAMIPGKWLKLVNTPTAGALPEEFWRTLVANRESSDTAEPPTQYWRHACEWLLAQNDYSPNHPINTDELLRKMPGDVPEPVVDFLSRVRAVVWNRKLFRTRDRTNEGFGSLGLAPDAAERGDIICILIGCSVPLVLRKKDRSQGVRSPRPPTITVGSRPPTRRLSVHRLNGSNRVNEILPQNQSTRKKDNDAHNSSEVPSASPMTSVDGNLHLLEEYSVIGECYLHGMMDGEAFAEQVKFGIQEKTFRLGCAVECTCPLCDI